MGVVISAFTVLGPALCAMTIDPSVALRADRIAPLHNSRPSSGVTPAFI
jgi:hypothetical protein